MTHLEAQIREALAAHVRPEHAPGMQQYLKSAMPCYGLAMPTMRSVVRPLIKANPISDRGEWEASIRRLWGEATHREERYAALELAGHSLYRRFRDAETLGLWRDLIIDAAWWDLCDWITNFVDDALRTHPDAVRPTLWAWAEDDELWLRRVSIICQLRAKDGTDVALLTHAIEANLEGSRYGSTFWIRKAIGWALRQYGRTDPAWVQRFVAEHHDQLSGLSRREALKHLG